MKKILFVILITSAISTNAQVKKVLFLGNSYTSNNNLPSLIKDIALSFSDTMITDQNTPGGHQLVQHAVNATTLSKISSQNWDNVVIQEQSQKPSFSPAQVATDVYPYAETLCDSITSNYSCSEPVFYMTWGRKNADAGPCANGLTTSCTYEGMQQRLRESYTEMATDNSCTVSPVGVAWKNLRDSFPSIELYTGDESHPSIFGSYLAACVFYATLYQKSPIGSTSIPVGIGTADGYTIQTVASYTVLDSMPLWRINANKPEANFSFNVTSSNGDVDFTNTSTNDLIYEWNFGDGNSSSLESPSHTYTGGNNTYNVELIIYSSDSCFSDTIVQTVDISATGINDLNNSERINIYPNPTNGFIEIKSNLRYNSISIIDLAGKTIRLSYFKSKVDIRDLPSGVYFIKLLGEEETAIRKFIRE